MIAKTNNRGRSSRGRGSGRRARPKNSHNAVGAYASDAWSLAKRTASGLNAIRKLINVEEKYIDVKLSTSTTSNAGAVDYLLPIVQGTDVSNRVGDSIRCQQLEYRLTVSRNGTDGNVRIIIFRDTENQGSAPSVSSVLQDISTGSLAIVSPYNFFNKNTNSEKNRFVILFDEMISVTSSETNVNFYEHFSSNLMRHARFRGTTAAVGSAAEGALFHLSITDQGATQPLVSWYSRVTYTDD